MVEEIKGGLNNLWFGVGTAELLISSPQERTAGLKSSDIYEPESDLAMPRSGQHSNATFELLGCQKGGC